MASTSTISAPKLKRESTVQGLLQFPERAIVSLNENDNTLKATTPSTEVKPFVKWAGGKRQLLNEIRKYVPENIHTYYEPFIGGGALLFDLQPKRFVVNDINADMINLYHTIKSNVEALIAELKTYKNDADFYYELRHMDRKLAYKGMCSIKKAARTLYLNKTCFNGLYRVNKHGQFNTPFGKYQNPDIINEVALRAVSKYFNNVDSVFLNADFEDAVPRVDSNCFVYLDPPYVPISADSSFTRYTSTGFDLSEHHRLKNFCDTLHKRKCKFLLSNSSTEFVHNLYKGYHIEVVKANRNINATGSARRQVDEVLIRNY